MMNLLRTNTPDVSQECFSGVSFSKWELDSRCVFSGGCGASHNQLASLPVCLFQLKNLASLALQFNLLASLPEDLGRLRNLMELVNTRTFRFRQLLSVCCFRSPGFCLFNVFSIVFSRTCPTTTWETFLPVWAVSPVYRSSTCLIISSVVCLKAWASSQVRLGFFYCFNTVSAATHNTDDNSHPFPLDAARLRPSVRPSILISAVRPFRPDASGQTEQTATTGTIHRVQARKSGAKRK